METVLIADDEKNIREGLKCILDWESLGFHICGEASNGEDALSGILQNNPSLVLLDIRMPKLTGIDIIRIAREQGYEGKFIILSGYSDFKYAQEAIRYGVQYYLTKPIDEDELEEILCDIKKQLDEECANENAQEHYRQKARNTIIHDILSGTASFSSFDPRELQLDASIYQVLIFEKYNHDTGELSYRFSDLLRVTNQDYHSYDTIFHNGQEVILLKGPLAIQKFNEF